MTETEVRTELGDPDRADAGIWFYFECLLAVTFDELKGGKVNNIDLTWRGAQCDVRYKDFSVFYTPADELVRIITGEPPATEEGTFTSGQLDLGLWRPVLPSWYSPEDPDDEYRKGMYWHNIGIGDGHVLADIERKAARRRAGGKP